MPIDFFESEVRKAQNRFNETFGTELVCNVNLRQSVILAICFMGNASKKIKAANNKDQVRSLIKKFMKTKKYSIIFLINSNKKIKKGGKIKNKKVIKKQIKRRPYYRERKNRLTGKYKLKGGKMDLLQNQIEPIKEKIDGNMCWGKINRNDYKKGFCPDCGTQLRMNGSCMFCECCGWSSCP